MEKIKKRNARTVVGLRCRRNVGFRRRESVAADRSIGFRARRDKTKSDNGAFVCEQKTNEKKIHAEIRFAGVFRQSETQRLLNRTRAPIETRALQRRVRRHSTPGWTMTRPDGPVLVNVNTISHRRLTYKRTCVIRSVFNAYTFLARGSVPELLAARCSY